MTEREKAIEQALAYYQKRKDIPSVFSMNPNDLFVIMADFALSMKEESQREAFEAGQKGKLVGDGNFGRNFVFTYPTFEDYLKKGE